MTNRNMVKPAGVPGTANDGAGERELPEPNRTPLPPMPAPESDPTHVATTVEPEDSPGAAQAPDEGLHRAGLRGRPE
jgi:hypothetical protein